MRVSYHVKAEAELLEAAHYYDSARAGIGKKFLDAFDTSVCSILQDPSRLPIVFDDVRRHSVQGFPYDIYFRTSHDVIRLLAVAHHSRAPDYWRTRQ